MGQVKSKDMLPAYNPISINNTTKPIQFNNTIIPREKIILETKIINNINKRYHLWITFLEDTYVKVSFINSINQRELIIKKYLKANESISVYDPFNDKIKDHPVKVGEIIHYGKATEPNKSYFIETFKDVKYNYIVESDRKNDFI